MSSTKKTFWTETLPDPLPANPLEMALQWLTQARLDSTQPNPDAMILATVDSCGRPSARVVLCKEIAATPGYLVFHTNYRSRKGNELKANPRAAGVFHWDHRHRQVRVEGQVELLAGAESDAYFRTRAWQSRLGAWASQQSQPIQSRLELAAAVMREAKRLGISYGGPGSEEPEGIDVDVPRPPHWGGYRLYVDAVELWTEGDHRIHDRARWIRTLPHDLGTGSGTPWVATRLQP